MGLEALGKKQYASIIDHGVTMAKNVAEFVKSQPTLELVMQPQLASVLFRSRPAQMAGSDSAAIALLNQRVGDALLESGRANVGVTEHNGVTCLKLTLLNPVVTLDDVKVLLSLVERTAQNCWRNKTLPISKCPAKPITAVIGFLFPFTSALRAAVVGSPAPDGHNRLRQRRYNAVAPARRRNNAPASIDYQTHSRWRSCYLRQPDSLAAAG